MENPAEAAGLGHPARHRAWPHDLVTVEALLRRAPRAILALLVGAALLCAPARAQDAQLLEAGQVRPEDADHAPGAPRPGRDAPPSAPPEAGEARPHPADITAQGRGVVAAATVSLSLDPATVTESGEARTVLVTATLGGTAVAAEEVVVQLAIGGGTAARGVDHSAVAAIPPARIAVGGSDATVTFTLAPTDDDTVEADETVVVTGAAPGHTVVPATLTITDSDRATVGVSRGPLYLLHSERGRYFSFSVTLDAPVDAEVKVPWGVHTPASPDALTFTPPGGTQTVVRPSGAGPADVTPSSGTVTLGGRAGTEGPPITLEVVRDDLSEGYESVGVELGIPIVQPGGIADRVALAASPRAVVGHIGPSDPVTVSLSGPDTVDEGAAATYTVSVLGPGTPTAPLTVTVTAEGVSATDFVPPPTQVTIAANGRSVTFAIVASADTAVEGDETLTVRISDPTGGGGGGTRLYSTQSSKETTIVNGDHIPVLVSFGTKTVSVTRGGSSAVVKVLLSAPPGRTVEIPITESRAAGVDPGDYGGVPDTITLGPFAAQGTFTVTSGAGDVDPGDRVTLRFGPLPDGLSDGGQMTVSLVALVGTISLGAAPRDGSVLHEQSVATVAVSATAMGAVPPGDLSFSVFVSDQSTATREEHGFPRGLVLGPPTDGTVFTGETAVLSVAYDLVAESHETIVLTASVPGYAVQAATLTVADRNRARLFVTPVQAQGTYREGSVISLIPLLNNRVEAMITLDYGISNLGHAREEADEFSPAAGSHVFHGVNDVRRRGNVLYAGPLFHITVNDDNLSEGRQAIRLSLSSVSTTPPVNAHGAPFESRVLVHGFEGPIPNSPMSIDPSDPVALSLSGPDTVAEGTAATYTVSVLPGGVHRDPVTVDISAEGAGTGDLSGTPMSVTIPAETTTATFSVTAVADGVDEGDETFTVTIGNPVGGGGGGFVEFVSRKETTILGTAGPARVTASFGREFLTVVEGSVASVTVSLSAAPGRALGIPVTWRHEGGAEPRDHGEIAGTVRVDAGATAGVLTVSAAADATDETGERVRLGFGDLPEGVVSGDPDRAVVLIADGAPSGIVRLGANPASVREGFDGDVTVTVAVDGAPPASDLPVTLSEESAGGDHTLGTGALPVVTVSSGESSVTVTVRLSVPQDGVVEPGRAVVVTAAAQGHAVEPLSVAVVDDDRAVLDVTAYEELTRGIRLEVTLEGQVDGSVSVPWSAVGDGIDGNDVEPAEGTLVFAPDAGEIRLFSGVRQAFERATVTILDDHLSEGDERVRFRLGNPVVSPGGGEVADRIGFRRRQSDARSVTDRPDPLSVAHAGVRQTTVTEGATLTHTVALQGDNRHTAPVTVDLSAALAAQGGHDSAEAGDFSFPLSVVIPVDATSATFTIATVDDMAVESTETFGISITGARGGGGDGWVDSFGDGWGVTVIDNDTVTVSFTEGRVWFFQPDDTQVVTATATPTEKGLTVNITTRLDGSTDPPGISSFFSGIPASLVFPRLATQESFTVTLRQPVDNTPDDAHIGLGASPGVVVGAPGSVSLVARMTNAEPGFDAPTDMVMVTAAENLNVGDTVGDPLPATDGDNDPLVFSFVEPTPLFGFGPGGQITLAATLDHEGQAMHTVTAGVRDGRNSANRADSGIDDRLTVVVQVDDVNENPRFNSRDAVGGTLVFTVAENTAVSVSLGAMPEATDPEGNSFRYFFWDRSAESELLGKVADASGPLTLDGRALRVGRPLDHETDPDLVVTVGVSDFLDGEGNVPACPGPPDPHSDCPGPNRFPTTGFSLPFDRVTVSVTVTDVDEPPGMPASLVAETLSIAQGGHTRLSLEWAVPSVTGTPPPVTGYEVGYRTGAMDFTAFAHAGTALETTVTGLIPDTPYELRVRAVNDAGKSAWVSATARTAMNAAPGFAAPAVTLAVAESAAVGAAVGAPVTAAANDLDDLAYVLGGADSALFGIGGDGQVSIAGALDFETAESHTLALTATDPFGGSDTAELVIAIGDVDEPPGVPASLVAETLSIAQGGHTRLSVSWAVPAVTGTPPPVTGYEVGYRTGAMDFTAFAHAGTALETTVTGLAPDTPYDLRVRAVNDEGKSAWVSATARTAMNAPPRFAAPAVTRAVAESAAVGAAVGAPVTAAANDLDDLTYVLGGTGATLFDIDNDGQVSVAAALDFETAESHILALTATDPFGGSDTLELVIAVGDVDEPPGVPGSLVAEALPIAQGGHTRLSVSWAVPAVTGTPPPITGYEVEYRTGAMDFAAFAHAGTALGTTVTGLVPDTPYELRVRAVNIEGESDWVAATARTARNAPPEFAAPTVTLAVAESAAVGAAVGAPVTAAANDLDDLAYVLGGADSALFGIGGDGQVSVAAALDFEAAAAHTLALTATDPFGGSDTVGLVIAIGDVDEPPGVPDSPVAAPLAVVEGGHTRLSLEWAASSNTGPPLTYEVEHRETVGATSSGHIGDGDTGYDVTMEGTSATVAGLAPGTGHDLRVRAVNAEGESAWVETTGTTRANTEPDVMAEAVTLTVAENTAVGTDLGDPITVEVDDTDVLTYTLAGTGAMLFIIGADGQVKVAREINFEELEADASVTMTTLSLDVTVSDPFGAQDTLGLVVVVTDVGGEMPEAPTLTVAGHGNSLSVGWQAPENAGPVTGYVVEYKERAAPDTDWMTVTVTATSATIRELEEETEYDVRVRALSDEGVGQWGQTDTAVDTGIGLRLLPRVADDPGAEFGGDDALLIFYFTQFNDVLSRPDNARLSRIVVRGLSRSRPLSDADADEIIAAASALGSGAIPASHPANLYGADPFENHDALLLFYSIQFGDILTRPELGRLMGIVVNGVLPSGHGLDGDGMRALVQAGRDLGRTL